MSRGPKKDKGQRPSALRELTPEQLKHIVGGGGPALGPQSAAPTHEEQFLASTQAAVDAGTMTAAHAVTAAMTEAKTDGVMAAQVEIDLAHALTGDTHANATGAVTALDQQITHDATGTSLVNQATTALKSGDAATAATVEHVVAQATAIAGTSLDMTLDKIGDSLAAGPASVGASAFDSDLAARVASGAAAEGVADDLAAGRIGSLAMKVVDDEAHIAGVGADVAAGTLFQAASQDGEAALMTEVAREVALGTTHDFAGMSAATAAQGIADMVSTLESSGVLTGAAAVAMGESVAGAAGANIDTMLTDLAGTAAAEGTGAASVDLANAILHGVVAEAAQGDISVVTAVADMQGIAGTIGIDAALVGLASDATLGYAADRLMADRITTDNALTDLTNEVRLGTITPTEALQTLAAEATAAKQDVTTALLGLFTSIENTEEKFDPATGVGQPGGKLSQDEQASMCDVFDTIRGVDVALAGALSNETLGAAAVEVINARIYDGAAVKDLSAEVAAGRLSAADASTTIDAELQAAFPTLWSTGGTAATLEVVTALGDTAAARILDLLVDVGSDKVAGFAWALASHVAGESAAASTAEPDFASAAALTVFHAARVAQDLTGPGSQDPDAMMIFSTADTATRQSLTDGTFEQALAGFAAAGLITGAQALQVLQADASAAGVQDGMVNEVVSLYGKVFDQGASATVDLGAAIAESFVAQSGDGAMQFAAQAYQAGALSQAAAASLDEVVAAQALAADVAAGTIGESAAAQQLWSHVQNAGLESGTIVAVTNDSLAASQPVWDNGTVVVTVNSGAVHYSFDQDVSSAELDLYKALGALGQTSAQTALADGWGENIQVGLGHEVATYGSAVIAADTSVYRAVVAACETADDFGGNLATVYGPNGATHDGAWQTNWVHSVLTMANPDAGDLAAAIRYAQGIMNNQAAAFEAGFGSGPNAFSAGLASDSTVSDSATGTTSDGSTAAATANTPSSTEQAENFAIGKVINMVAGKMTADSDGSVYGELSRSALMAKALSVVMGSPGMEDFLGAGVAGSFAQASGEYALAINTIGAFITGTVEAAVIATADSMKSIATDLEDIDNIDADMTSGNLAALGTDAKKFGDDFASGAKTFGSDFAAAWGKSMQAMSNGLIQGAEGIETDPSYTYDQTMEDMSKLVAG